MLSICIVIASIAAAAYLIFKKYYAPGALLFVGLITLGVVACISPDPLITGKKATHLAGLDVIQIFTNLLQTRTAGLGMNIMAIAGFTYFMDQIGASGALVRLSVKPLKLIKAPYIVMTLGFILRCFHSVCSRLSPPADGLPLPGYGHGRYLPSVCRSNHLGRRLLLFWPVRRQQPSGC